MLKQLSNERLIPRLQAVVYLGLALFLVAIFVDQYLQGLYSLVYANSPAIPILLFSAVYIFINRDSVNYQRINLPMLVLLGLIAIAQLPEYPELMLHYMFALPLLSYFALPLRRATLYNIILLLMVLGILFFDRGIIAALRSSTNMALMVGSAWCFSYLTQLKLVSLKKLTLTDPISGVYNARHFKQLLKREVARSQGQRQSLSMVGIVIDEYQQLIDLHGHTNILGFLPKFAARARQLIRAEDELFRLRDDLFMMVLPNCGEEGAIVLMERLNRQLQEHLWPNAIDVQLCVAVVTRHHQEDASTMERRLMGRLKALQRTSLQLAAFHQSNTN